MTDPISTISDILAQGETFLIAAHASPDGDAIGSTVALAHLLTRMGKSVTLYNPSGMPDAFTWLNLPAPLTTTLPATLPQWTIALDCGAQHRLGDELAGRFTQTGTVNIDHHLGNPNYGEFNWVDPIFSSVGEMIARLAEHLEQPLSGDLGEAIYLAIVSDTGYFSFGNTRPETLELSAEILRQGLDPEVFNARLQNQWTLNRLKLWSLVLGTTTLHNCGTIGSISITRQMLESTGTSKQDCDGLVNYVRRVRGVKAALCLREDEPNLTKISLRSSGNNNVQVVASQLGGGGHKNASGCVIEAPLAEAKKILLDTVDKFFVCE